MTRAASTVDEYAYAAPDPVKVCKILDGYGIDGVMARWLWKSRSALEGIAKAGREILRGQTGGPRPARRAIPVETEERILRAARCLSSANLAAQALGVSESLVRTIHRERGVPIPTMPATERCAKSVATLRARRAGVQPEAPSRPYTPRHVDPEAVLAAWKAGKAVKEIARELGCSIAPIYRVLSGRGAIHGVPKKLPDDSVIRANVLAGMGQHAMAKKYGCTRGAVCHRIAAMGLQGASAQPRSVRKLPDDATLRADRLSGLSLRAAAARYGVSSSIVGKHWKSPASVAGPRTSSTSSRKPPSGRRVQLPQLTPHDNRLTAGTSDGPELQQDEGGPPPRGG